MKKIKIISIICMVIIALSTTIILSCSKDKEFAASTESDCLHDMEDEQCPNVPEVTRENIDDMICFYYHEYVNTLGKSSNTGIIEAIWKWIVAHTGRDPALFETCNYSNPCGPCPGICLNSKDGEVFSKVSDDYLLSKDEYDDGIRLFQAALFNDTIMGLNFIQSCFVAADGNFYVPEDFSIGSQASAAFGKNDIIIKEGTYPVSCIYSQNGTTLVNVQSF